MNPTEFEPEARTILEQLERLTTQERELSGLRDSIGQREKAQQGALLKALERGADAPKPDASLVADRTRAETLSDTLPQFSERIERRAKTLQNAVYKEAGAIVDQRRKANADKTDALTAKAIEACEALHTHIGTMRYRGFIIQLGDRLTSNAGDIRNDSFDADSVLELVIQKWEGAKAIAEGVLEVLPELKIVPAVAHDSKKSARLAGASK